MKRMRPFFSRDEPASTIQPSPAEGKSRSQSSSWPKPVAPDIRRPGLKLSVEDGLDVVAIGIEQERRVVAGSIVLPQARLPVVPGAGLEACAMERFHVFAIRRFESYVDIPAEWSVTGTDDEVAVLDRRPVVSGLLDPQGPQDHVIEADALAQVGDAYVDVVDQLRSVERGASALEPFLKIARGRSPAVSPTGSPGGQPASEFGQLPQAAPLRVDCRWPDATVPQHGYAAVSPNQIPPSTSQRSILTKSKSPAMALADAFSCRREPARPTSSQVQASS